MQSITHPLPDELYEMMNKAEDLEEEIRGQIKGIVRLHNPDGPPFITGSELDMASDAILAYEELRRERHPEPHEVESRLEAGEAFLALEEAGIDITQWEFFGRLENDTGFPRWQFCHRRRRDLTYLGPRTIEVSILK